MKLTKEDQEILDSVEKGEWRRIPGFRREAARYREAARAASGKDKKGQHQNFGTRPGQVPEGGRQ